MKEMTEERYGKLALANILASIWLGDWERYESIFTEMPEYLHGQFPFHRHYNREQAELWHENHFFIPGEYFISPYLSSYTQSGNDGYEKRRSDLLCLIGLYDKTGFYYPLEKEIYPDHIGCMTLFLGTVIKECINAETAKDEEYLAELAELERHMLDQYIIPILHPLKNNAESKIEHPFFKEFLAFYIQVMKEEQNEAA